jgi:hypothetical protein
MSPPRALAALRYAHQDCDMSMSVEEARKTAALAEFAYRETRDALDRWRSRMRRGYLPPHLQEEEDALSLRVMQAAEKVTGARIELAAALMHQELDREQAATGPHASVDTTSIDQ